MRRLGSPWRVPFGTVRKLLPPKEGESSLPQFSAGTGPAEGGAWWTGRLTPEVGALLGGKIGTWDLLNAPDITRDVRDNIVEVDSGDIVEQGFG